MALAAADYDCIFQFYCDGLGIEPAELWTTEQGQAALLNLGRATLELFDEGHAAQVDQIEAGRRTSGKIRFALQVPDLEAALERLVSKGARVVHPPVVTPWNHYNVRLEDPEGMQITLFQVRDGSLREGD